MESLSLVSSNLGIKAMNIEPISGFRRLARLKAETPIDKIPIFSGPKYLSNRDIEHRYNAVWRKLETVRYNVPLINIFFLNVDIVLCNKALPSTGMP